MSITQKQLKHLFSYDSATGVFSRITDNKYAMNAKRGPAGYNSAGYIRIKISGKSYSAHRLAWLFVYGHFPSRDLDHINGVKNDNRIANLRECTMSQNQSNRRLQRNNSTGVKGTSFHKTSGKYQCRVTKNGRQIYLGLFDSLDDAKTAYNKAAEAHHGEFARFE